MTLLLLTTPAVKHLPLRASLLPPTTPSSPSLSPPAVTRVLVLVNAQANTTGSREPALELLYVPLRRLLLPSLLLLLLRMLLRGILAAFTSATAVADEATLPASLSDLGCLCNRDREPIMQALVCPFEGIAMFVSRPELLEHLHEELRKPALVAAMQLGI
jgi:hypothetical protein